MLTIAELTSSFLGTGAFLVSAEAQPHIPRMPRTRLVGTYHWLANLFIVVACQC